jgi:hypothetical protein
LKNKNIIRAAETVFRIFPNPSSGDFNISCNGKANLVVYNSWGEKLFSDSFENSTVFGKNLPKGLFFALIDCENGQSKTFKLIKQ